MMATASVDETVKIWDILNSDENGGPKCIAGKKLAMGEIFTLSYYKDIPWVLAAGGSKGELAIWDSEENETIAKHFGGRLNKEMLNE
jgi:periodic tryptophan protein 1